MTDITTSEPTLADDSPAVHAQACAYCGGPVEAPGPATLDYCIDLPPKGSATLWLTKPFQPVKAPARLASLDPTKLLRATERVWRSIIAVNTRLRPARSDRRSPR